MDLLVGALILCAAVGVLVTLCGVSLVLTLDGRWRPICQAYLEARCKQMGTPMEVPRSDEAPGRLLPPFTDEELDNERDLYAGV